MIWPLLAGLAWAQQAEDADGTMVVREDTPAAGSGRTLGQAEIQALPARSADELLRAMPGLHMSAHGGRGKAYQYFLRGFDAVHGGDLAVDVEGVPLNELSNPHAHGYLDLNLLPTVLLRRLELSPGSAKPEVRDFAVAGSASFSLGLSETGGMAQLGVGSDRSALATLAWRPEARSAGNFLVLDTTAGQGRGSARSWQQGRLAAGVEGPLGSTQARAWVLAYAGDFASPGVLREADLAQGSVDFYGAYPGSGGGRSRRVLGGAQLSGGAAGMAWQLQGYGGARTLQLEQNFTGWYADPVHGDATRQALESMTGGLQARAGWSVSPGVLVQGGASLRLEQVARQTDAISTSGQVHDSGAMEEALHLQGGLWAAAEVQRGAWTLSPALRGDALSIARQGQRSWAPVLSPKLSLSRSGEHVQVFGSYGRGFRSTDLGGAEGGSLPVTQVHGADLGLQGALGPKVGWRSTLFGSRVSSEVVFDHVEARYLSTGASERIGLEAGLQLQLLSTLRLEVDLSYAYGRYQGSQAPIPYAPRLLMSTTLQSLGMPLGPGELSGSVRGWVLGPRALPLGFVSRPTGMVDLKLRYQLGRWGVGLEVDNALLQPLRDGEFVYPSHWDLNTPRSELPARHITAATPPAARLSLYWSF